MMRPRRLAAIGAVGFSCACLAIADAPRPAQAFDPIGTVCGIGGVLSGLVGKACNVGGKLLGVGKKVLGAGNSGTTSGTQAAIGLAAISAWVAVGAQVALHETAKVISHTTAPRLTTTWFSATYWRMAAIGAVLTMPFLFAAAVQAILRSDISLLMRSALGYLPLALLSVGIAAPLAMLLLTATDEMCAVVSSAAGHAGVRFLTRAGELAGGLSIISRSPFLVFLAALVAAFGALALWVELLMREAAVYVVVLMLPVAFAALVWPARRIWAIRAVELLVALILSKFAIVAVLSLAGAALGEGPLDGLSRMLVGGVLVILGALAPWALLRLLPLAELASGAAGALRGEYSRASRELGFAGQLAGAAAFKVEDLRSAPASADDGPREAAMAHTERLAEQRALPQSVAELDGGGGAAAGASAAGAGAAGAPEAAAENSGAAERPEPSERLPGLDPQFQMDDFTWPLNLDPDEGTPPIIRPIDDEPNAGAEPVPEVPDIDPAPEHDPEPPLDEPPEGRL